MVAGSEKCTGQRQEATKIGPSRQIMQVELFKLNTTREADNAARGKTKELEHKRGNKHNEIRPLKCLHEINSKTSKIPLHERHYLKNCNGKCSKKQTAPK
jgi:hypothetical protein